MDAPFSGAAVTFSLRVSIKKCSVESGGGNEENATISHLDGSRTTLDFGNWDTGFGIREADNTGFGKMVGNLISDNISEIDLYSFRATNKIGVSLTPPRLD